MIFYTLFSDRTGKNNRHYFLNTYKCSYSKAQIAHSLLFVAIRYLRVGSMHAVFFHITSSKDRMLCR